MEIDFDLYKVFVSVATNGSVSKAAEELSVTQSAVSQSILKLEKIFEKELFVRSRQGVTLTSFGRVLFENVSHTVNDLSHVYEKMNNLKEAKKTIKIGASDIITTNLMMPVIKKYFSDTHFYIESLKTDKEKIIAVENGELDFAIINDYNLPLGSNLYKKKLISLEYGFYVNPEMYDEVSQNLFEQTLLVKNAGTKGRVEFNKKFYALAYKFKNIMEFSHDDTIIKATEAGLGVGFCPKQYVSNLLKELFVSDEKLIKNVVLIYQQPSEVIEIFVNEIKK